MIPEISSLSIRPFLQTLAIIQTTVLSIIIAIYALSTQITAERFTTRIINSVKQNSSYSHTVLLFIGSIFLDVFALLMYQTTPEWLTWTLLLGAVSGVVLTFGSLIYLKDELLANTQASSVAEAIRDGINKDEFQAAVKENNTTIPFYNFFEAGQSTIKNEDKDAANQLVVALCSSTEVLINEMYSSVCN